jgi:hypothetical protein
MGMLQAGLGLVLFIFSEIIMWFVFTPLLTTIIPLMQTMTPPYWWNYLGGNQMVWIAQLIWTVMTLAVIIGFVRLFVEIQNRTTYNSEDSW